MKPHTTLGPRGRQARLGSTVLLGCCAWLALAACNRSDAAWVSPLAFDTASAWFYDGSDSTRLLVEIAASDEQRTFGLSRRPSLDPGSGMVFEFDSLQTGDNGFWMWRTNVPLDIAFLDADGVIRRILSMEVCGARAESCPSYPPGVDYARALEVNLGWFSGNGIAEGDRVTVLR